MVRIPIYLQTEGRAELQRIIKDIAMVCQKFPNPLKADRECQYSSSFQLANIRSQTDLHCYWPCLCTRMGRKEKGREERGENGDVSVVEGVSGKTWLGWLSECAWWMVDVWVGVGHMVCVYASYIVFLIVWFVRLGGRTGGTMSHAIPTMRWNLSTSHMPSCSPFSLFIMRIKFACRNII